MTKAEAKAKAQAEIEKYKKNLMGVYCGPMPLPYDKRPRTESSVLKGFKMDMAAKNKKRHKRS